MYKLTILSRSGVVARTETGSVLLPTAAGEIEILPLHRTYCGVLREGVVRYTEPSKGDRISIPVKGGFAEFSGKELIVFATLS